jgi:hypothetical protein
VGGAEAQQRTFFCGEESFVTITILNASTITAGLIEGQTLTMQAVPGQQWTYFNGDYQVIIAPDQNSMKLMIPDFGEIGCVFQAGQDAAAPPPPPPPTFDSGGAGGGFPVAAKSWGGSVRAGPGVEYEKVGSLAEGQPITILEQSPAPFFQERPWFKIGWNGRTGYHWGGIICPLGAEVPGTFQVC